MRGPRNLVRAVLALALLLSSAVTLQLGRAAAVDIYVTPGTYTVNGRQWQTACGPYSATIDRCTTTIWATTVVYSGGSYKQVTGWAFNNLTYKLSPRAGWETFNHLVTPGEHDIAGRKWRTECYTSWTGSSGCRSQILATVVELVGGRYQRVTKWVFNNQVYVTQSPCTVTLAAVRTAVGKAGIAPTKCTVSKQNPAWLAVEYVASDAGNGRYVETAFFRKSGTTWNYAARSGISASHICTWFRAAGVPLDLVGTVSYCYYS